MNRYYLSQLNYEGLYFAEGFLHNRPCFDIAFAQSGVIPRTRNRFDEIVAVNFKPYKKSKIKEAPVANMPSCEISWWKNVNEKEKKFFLPNLQYFQFGQDGWTTFFMKISWIWTCSQIFIRISYWENMLTLGNKFT